MHGPDRDASAAANDDVALTTADLRALADEQTALRHVAELVARGVALEKVFAAVVAEASMLLDGGSMTLTRFEGDDELVVEAACGGPALGSRIRFAPETVPDRVRRGDRVGRVGDYDLERGAKLAAEYGLAAAVAAPIAVHGEVWGMLTGTSATRVLPRGTEHLLQQFAELVAAALANSHARAELQALADAQTALRRIAQLSVQEADVGAVLQAIAVEASRLAGVEFGMVLRFVAPDGTNEIVALDGAPANFELGMRAPGSGDGSVHRVWRTGHAARVDNLDAMPGRWPQMASRFGFSTSAGVPILLQQGELWGVIIVAGQDTMPVAIESHLADFAEIAGAAIANAENRAKLTASRARVVATADETRRKVQRDLHDGAQQRLVHTLMTLGIAKQAAADGRPAAELIDEAIHHAERANRELRDLVRGVLPASLTHGGLYTAIESLVSEMPVPIEVQANVPRLPPNVETTAYFVVAEALTNVIKHAHATHATVTIHTDASALSIQICDDGRGGADPVSGTGLTGLLDRVEASNGTLTLTSPPTIGTTLHVTLPLGEPNADDHLH